MERQTDIAQTIELAADRARYDECAKKLLTYKAVIAWILKSCTKEFSQYSVKFICDNCLNENVELSEHAVHQDQLNRDERLNGDKRLDGLNTEANAVKDQTVYYDIRFKATLPESKEPVQLIINLEIQLNDTPGYPLVTRGFYYCARMISEQYGTVFTDEHYEKIQKVYSIWICPDPAKKRKNGIFRYHTVEDSVRGNSFVKSEAYDLMEVVILNLGDADESSDLEILDLLNVLFSTTATPEEKKKRLNDEFDIERIVVSTYQAVSGAGVAGMEELYRQSQEVLDGKEPVAKTLPCAGDKKHFPIAFNCIPQVDKFDLSNGYSKEEMKMVNETKKIFNKDIEVNATCVRVPVLRGHSESIYIETKKPIDMDKVFELLGNSTGIDLCDDLANQVYPMPTSFIGDELTHVGRVRKDLYKDNALSLWITGDQLMKGAAYNSVDIGLKMIELGLLK